jgi:hypothetical protein
VARRFRPCSSTALMAASQLGGWCAGSAISQVPPTVHEIVAMGVISYLCCTPGRMPTSSSILPPWTLTQGLVLQQHFVISGCDVAWFYAG